MAGFLSAISAECPARSASPWRAPRSSASAKAASLLRRSMVLVVTLNQLAISLSDWMQRRQLFQLHQVDLGCAQLRVESLDSTNEHISYRLKSSIPVLTAHCPLTHPRRNLNSVEKIVDCPVPLFSFAHSSSASYEENRGQFEAALEDVLESAARSADQLSETVKLAEGRVIAVPADVSDRASVKVLVRSVEFMLDQSTCW